ncbi:NAD(P)-dependent alcohol dehydrogenase [Amnibacterium kyonggiense]|uniref:alcohol dehydrogenase (NADP(+)) n=1 Tax=Amnibacterium kyonggiense TaxID=595671 RepID=A0A4R7FLC5_9MICO|nr:NAD(P)-dependent alcohol dehydrogenase [Amnibacterium kyonggiense]TDS77200.1 putative zinc-type alcohol dehydrogenase-like protein [Amnibacterium kyonggiense]
MTTTVPALLTDGPGAAFHRGTVERRDLGPNDVAIDIAFAGICHSDIHQAREEWGGAIFPMVPGHEIAGTVSAVGSEVTRYAVGDRVGVGCFVDSCRECEYCLAGEEQFCLKGNVATYNGRGYDGDPTYGGYSTAVVVDERYVLRVPEGIALDVAAPLLCAGITTYSPLKHWGAGPGTKVAVVGLGGLGHMAVQLAHAMGADVTVISRTRRKEADATGLGADHFVATAEEGALKGLRNTFDLIINTVSADVDLDGLLCTLRVGGSLVYVGAPSERQSFAVFSLIGGRRSVAGSNIGGIRETQEMLDFCGEHGIGAVIETIGADEVTAAYDRVVDGGVHYRYVIDTATIPA